VFKFFKGGSFSFKLFGMIVTGVFNQQFLACSDITLALFDAKVFG